MAGLFPDPVFRLAGATVVVCGAQMPVRHNDEPRDGWTAFAVRPGGVQITPGSLPLRDDEVAVQNRVPFRITHKPGHMFVSGRTINRLDC